MNALDGFGKGRAFLTGLCFLCSVSGADAQPVIYQAAGTREEIQPVIDQFKHDILYGVGGDVQNPPPILGSFKLATFEDTSAGSARTVAQASVGIQSGGITFVGGPGSPAMVSAGTTDPNDPNRSFGDLNPSLPPLLEAFSGPSVIALQSFPFGSTFRGFLAVADMQRGPAGDVVAFLPFNAYGAVFTGVDAAAGVTISGDSLQLIPPNSKPFSFFGVINPSVHYGSITVYLPALGADASKSLVTLDDFILGKAYPLPEPGGVLLVAMGVGLLFAHRRRRPRTG